MFDFRKKVVSFGDFVITTIIMDESNYTAFCKSLSGLTFADKGNNNVLVVTDKIVQNMIENKHIPLMLRGSITNFIFEQFGIETDRAAFIVSGFGAELLKSVMDDLNSESRLPYPPFSAN